MFASTAVEQLWEARHRYNGTNTHYKSHVVCFCDGIFGNEVGKSSEDAAKT
jgi:hypothetical protein